MSKVYDQLRYSNCWEDADLLLSKLDIEQHHRVLSVGSAGDNSFSILTQNPANLHIIDINPHQIELIALKIAAFKTLNHKTFLQFLGFRTHANRMTLFEKVKPELSPSSISYWDEHKKSIIKGVIFSGKFDRYLQLFANRIIPLIHSKKVRRKLLEEKSQEEQILFYKKYWNTTIWRLLFKVFFSRRVMGFAGRHPSFFDHVEMEVSDFILQQTEQHFTSQACQNNHFLHFILFGKFGEQLPHYARKENFDQIRNNIDCITLELTDILNLKSKDQFDIFNLSNIFEYLGDHDFRIVSEKLSEFGRSSAQYAYWNLMVSRTLSKTNSIFKENYRNSDREDIDLGFFYKDFIISKRQ